MPIPPVPTFRLLRIRPLHRIICDKEWQCDLRLVDFDLWIVTKGVGRLAIDGTNYAVKAPQVFLFSPGQRVVGKHDVNHPFEVWCFHFSSLRKDVSALRKFGRACQGMELRKLPFLLALLEGFCEQESHQDAVASQQKQHFMKLIFSILWRQAHSAPALPSDAKVETLVDDILKYPEDEWSLEKMTAASGLATTQLYGRFQAIVGTSPAKFVINTRIRKACHLLKETTLTISEVAEACGYRDVFFFSRQFKQKQKMAPSMFRSGVSFDKNRGRIRCAVQTPHDSLKASIRK